MLIDAHSHIPLRAGVLTLQMELDGAGIHPWNLDARESFDHYLKKFEALKLIHPKPLLVGECGLDRKRVGILGIAEQREILQAHFNWAQELARPIVLHCVHAESDILSVLKECRFKGVILWHDFRGSAQVLHALKDYNVYFSLGARLLTHELKSQEIIKLISIERLLLETDDESRFSIEEIYQKASELLDVDFKKLEQTIEQNLEAMFSNFDDVSASDLINNLRTRALT